MENFAHTLVGATIAEAITTKTRVRLTRVEVYFASILASNFPDLDFLAARLTGGQLGYLLHHRGHTHTIGGIVLLAASLAGIASLIQKWRKKPSGWTVFCDWFLVLLAGLSVHVFMDFWNSYGVHPFWPINVTWFSLDAVSIVEPWLELLLIPAVWFSLQSRYWKLALAGLSLLTAGLTVFFLKSVPLMLIPFAAAIPLWIWTINKARRHGRVVAMTWSGVAILICLLIALSSLSRNQIKYTLQKSNPETEIHDIALTPFPANPLCWFFASVELSGPSKELYQSQIGILSLLPAISPPASCIPIALGATTSRLSDVPHTHDNAQFAWIGRYQLPLKELRDLYDTDCTARAYFRFLRVPFVGQLPDGTRVLGDLRFDRSVGRDFAEIPVGVAAIVCPKFIPNWNIRPTVKVLTCKSEGGL